jgi:hypothetical protein
MMFFLSQCQLSLLPGIDAFAATMVALPPDALQLLRLQYLFSL